MDRTSQQGRPGDFQGTAAVSLCDPGKREPGAYIPLPQSAAHHRCPVRQAAGTLWTKQAAVLKRDWESTHKLDSSGHKPPNQPGRQASFICKTRAITPLL